MPKEALSWESVEFLQETITSIRQLEVLLFLYDRREQSWTSPEIATHLCCDKDATEKWLTEFWRQGLLRCSERTPHAYRFFPKEPALERRVADLAREYENCPSRIASIVADQLTSKMTIFMNAFCIRSEKEPNDAT